MGNAPECLFDKVSGVDSSGVLMKAGRPRRSVRRLPAPMRQATEYGEMSQRSLVFDSLVANVRLRMLASRRRASGLPCDLSSHSAGCPT